MSWAPNDLVSDTDLVAYERTILTQLGADDWRAKRQKTLEDWLFPSLAAVGLDPYRLRTRYQAEAVFGLTSDVFTDYTGEAKAVGEAGIPLATVLATSDDFLYIGAPWQFRGLSIRMFDDVSSATAAITVEAWRDAWQPILPLDDSTLAVNGRAFSKGGALMWTVPEDWVLRIVNNSAPLYWVRLSLNAAPTGAAIGQVGVIRRSALCGPATLRTLYTIFREAQMQQDGPWEAKATQYLEESQLAWQRVQPLLGREFDVETADDQIDASEATQTTESASGGGWRWERG